MARIVICDPDIAPKASAGWLENTAFTILDGWPDGVMVTGEPRRPMIRAVCLAKSTTASIRSQCQARR